MNRLVIFILSIVCLCASSAHNVFHSKSALVATNFYGEESPRKKAGHYFLYPFHGWYALSWIYWIKVKLIVIAFFVGTAFIWTIQYISKIYHHCPKMDHIHYGHYYRSLDDPAIVRFVQNRL